MQINKPCSNSLLHSQPNATQPTNLRQQCSHRLRNSLSLIFPRSIQQEGEAVDVEDMDVVGVQTWGTQEFTTLEPHLQILFDAADKAACPPLVEVPDTVVVQYSLHNKQCHAIQHRCIRISSRSIQTRMYVFRVDLTLRMGIPRRHAPPRGDV
jgi:hypothetical protein